MEKHHVVTMVNSKNKKNKKNFRIGPCPSFCLNCWLGTN